MKKKIQVFIQCNGRGHLTQFQGMYDLLKEEYDFLPPILVIDSLDEIPSYITDQEAFQDYKVIYGPSLKYDKTGNFKFSDTLFSALSLKSIWGCLNSLVSGWKIVKDRSPHLIINFYEPIGNLISVFHPTIPVMNIGHQFLADEEFYFPETNKFNYKLLNRFCSLRGSKLCLSYYTFYSTAGNIPCPPILKSKVYDLVDKTDDHNFVLIYMTKPELLKPMEQALSIFKTLPKIKIYAQTEEPYTITLGSNNTEVEVKPLNEEEFLEDLRCCSLLVNNGGFGSNSEALYLGKRLMCRPVHNHIEQELNALDAQNTKGSEVRVARAYSDLVSMMPDGYKPYAWKRDDIVYWFGTLKKSLKYNIDRSFYA